MAEDEALMKIANAAVLVMDKWIISTGRQTMNQSMVLAMDALRDALRDFKELDTSPELFEKMAEHLKQVEEDLSTAVATDDH